MRSPFLAQYGMCAVTHSYIALFLSASGLAVFCASAVNQKKHTAKTKTTYFFAAAKSIIHGTKQMFQSTWRSSSSLLTKPRSCCATVPCAAGGLFSASLHKTVRYICWLGVGTYHGSYGTALRIASRHGFCAQHSAVAVVSMFPAGRLFWFAAT